jgi:hypothetical protein
LAEGSTTDRKRLPKLPFDRRGTPVPTSDDGVEQPDSTGACSPRRVVERGEQDAELK